MFTRSAVVLSASAALVAATHVRADAGDQKGRTVANVGDVRGTGVDGYAVSTPYDDNVATNAGRVVVESWDGGGYDTSVIIGTIRHDRFGWSVDGSQGRVIIGTPYNDERGRNAGRVWVYEWDAMAMDFVLWKSWRGRNAGDRYGQSVATGVDVNDDGFDDFLVGAPYVDKSGKRNRGAVYVISGKTGKGLKTLYGENRGDLYGWAVAGVGRANRDDEDDFAVGAPRNDDGASNAGKAYVISGRDCETLYEIPGQQRGEQLGRAVAGICRADDDGFDDVAVGAPYHDRRGRRNAGKVVVYSSKRGEKLWHKFGRRKHDWLGWFVAKAWDVNCDDHDDVMIGAPRYDRSGFVDNGRVYVRSGRNGAHLESLYQSDLQDRARFGFSGLTLCDFEGTDTTLYLVGAPLFNSVTDANEGNVDDYDSTFMCTPGPFGPQEGAFRSAPERPSIVGDEARGIATRVDDDETHDMSGPDLDSALPEDFTVGDVLDLLDPPAGAGGE